MYRTFLVLGIIIFVVAGFLGWQYISFASLKSKCLALIDSEKIEVQVLFPKGTGLNEGEIIKAQVLSIPGVSSFEFVSEEQALKEFRDKHKGTSVDQALDSFSSDDNPIQPYASIRVDNATNLDSLFSRIRNKGLEYGFSVTNFFPDGSVIGVRNVVNGFSFNFPFRDSKENNALKSCSKEGWSGVSVLFKN